MALSIHRKRFDLDDWGPLHGLRVLDMSRLVAGNMLTLQLADFGADVVKIEPLPNGDPLRAWGDGSVSTHWKTYSRNKRSLSVDLRRPEGVDLVRRLAGQADVLVENFIPGRMEEIGLAPDALIAANSGLIVVRISGFGQTGPYRDRPGFGTLVEAMSGFADRNGFPDREPVLPPMALADMAAGLYGAMAVLVALYDCVINGGDGQVIDLSLLESVFSILGADAAGYAVDGAVKQRSGSASNTASPRNVYATRDGKWVALSASIQSMAERVFRVVGRPDLIDDPRFRTNADRVRHRDEVDAVIGAWVAARTLNEALAAFGEAGVTAAPVYNVAQFLRDPHVIKREVVVDLPDADAGRFPMHNVVPRLSRTPGSFRRPAPALGEHNDELLRESGLSPEEVAALRERGVIG